MTTIDINKQSQAEMNYELVIRRLTRICDTTDQRSEDEDFHSGIKEKVKILLKMKCLFELKQFSCSLKKDHLNISPELYQLP